MSDRCESETNLTVIRSSTVLAVMPSGEVNGHLLLLQLKDIHTQVKEERRLLSANLGPRLAQIESDLGALSAQVAEVENRLARVHVTWFDGLLARLVPGPLGNSARQIIASCRRDKQWLKKVSSLIEEINGQRVAIGKAVDTAVHSYLLQTSEEYRDLAAAMDAHVTESALGSQLAETLRKDRSLQNLSDAHALYKHIGAKPDIENPSSTTVGIEEWNEYVRQCSVVVAGLDRYVMAKKKEATQIGHRLDALRTIFIDQMCSSSS